MHKLACTKRNLANILLNCSTGSDFQHFTENDNDLLSKVREDMVEGPPVVFTRKTLVDKTHPQIHKCLKMIVGKGASELHLNQCVPLCLPDVTQDMSRMQVCNDSNPVRTIIEFLKMW